MEAYTPNHLLCCPVRVPQTLGGTGSVLEEKGLARLIESPDAPHCPVAATTVSTLTKSSLILQRSKIYNFDHKKK